MYYYYYYLHVFTIFELAHLSLLNLPKIGLKCSHQFNDDVLNYAARQLFNNET